MFCFGICGFARDFHAAAAVVGAAAAEGFLTVPAQPVATTNYVAGFLALRVVVETQADRWAELPTTHDAGAREICYALLHVFPNGGVGRASHRKIYGGFEHDVGSTRSRNDFQVN